MKILQTLENPNKKCTTLYTFTPHIATILLFHDVVFTVYINYLVMSTSSTLAQSFLITQVYATSKLFCLHMMQYFFGLSLALFMLIPQGPQILSTSRTGPTTTSKP